MIHTPFGPSRGQRLPHPMVLQNAIWPRLCADESLGLRKPLHCGVNAMAVVLQSMARVEKCKSDSLGKAPGGGGGGGAG